MKFASNYSIAKLFYHCFITMYFLHQRKIWLRRPLSALIYLFLTSSSKLSTQTECLYQWVIHSSHTMLSIWAFALGTGYFHAGLLNPRAKGSYSAYETYYVLRHKMLASKEKWTRWKHQQCKNCANVKPTLICKKVLNLNRCQNR